MRIKFHFILYSFYFIGLFILIIFLVFWIYFFDNLYELFDGVRTYLKNNNENYKELHKQIHKILDSNVTLQKLLDDEVLEDGLSKEDCLSISKIFHLYYDLQDIIEKEIYFKGGMDAYYYFGKLGIIKNK